MDARRIAGELRVPRCLELRFQALGTSSDNPFYTVIWIPYSDLELYSATKCQVIWVLTSLDFILKVSNFWEINQDNFFSSNNPSIGRRIGLGFEGSWTFLVRAGYDMHSWE